MYHQLMSTLLAGMPMTVSKAGQINALYYHLKALNDPNLKSFGLFSDSFKKFMYSTGQFR